MGRKNTGDKLEKIELKAMPKIMATIRNGNVQSINKLETGETIETIEKFFTIMGKVVICAEIVITITLLIPHNLGILIFSR